MQIGNTVCSSGLKITRYKSEEPRTPYAPTWDFSIGSTVVPLDVELLSKTCLKKEKEINKLPTSLGLDGQLTDGYTGLGYNSTTAKWRNYNVLEWDTPQIKMLRKYIKAEVGEYNRKLGNPFPSQLWIQCWVNIMRWGQKISPHMHGIDPSSYLSAHFTVQCDNTSTCYHNPLNTYNSPHIIEEKNKPGSLTIFPSYLPHYTTRHNSFKPRITIAMDMGLESGSGICIEL